MIELYNLGISENTINSMIEIEPFIKELSENDIKDKINILKNIFCTDEQIINIIGSNPHYLNKTNEEISKLFNTLINYHFTTLNILFDSNPYILNLESFEIHSYINKRIRSNESLEDIVDELDSNPYLFNEI